MIFLLLFISYTCHLFTENASQLQITHYEGISLINCGLRKPLTPIRKNCFFWYSSAQQRQLSSIGVNGRDAEEDEFPWTAFFDTGANASCTAILLNTKWLITAAHCVHYSNDTKKYRIIFGSDKEYTENEVDVSVTHPNYANNSYNRRIFDVALLRLKYEIAVDLDPHYGNYKINSICLPQKYYINTKSDLAVINGCGLRRHNQHTDTMRAGILTIFGHRQEYINETCFIDPNIVCACSNLKNAHTMVGDSGGPVFQYVDGRAVLVAVQRSKRTTLNRVGPCKGGVYQISTRVSYLIDWITATINSLL